MKTQREMPWIAELKAPRFAPRKVVDEFESYRDAVVWCWENRQVHKGAGEKMDQALCANMLGLHTPHMSRCVNKQSNAPMNLNPDYLPDFEAFCGWYAVSQYIASKAQFTLMEQVIADRRAVA